MLKEKITSFFAQCVRVWHILRKPTKDEFLMISKVSALGIMAIGLIGFIISVLMAVFK